MPPYNPVNDFYLRQAQPYQQFNFPPQQSIPQINCRFVTNREEARAALIDGFSYNLFLDTGNGKIYLKKLNNNGVSDFIEYSASEEVTDPLSEINSRLTKIEHIIGGRNESISDNSSVQQSTAISDKPTSWKNERNDEAKSTSLSESYGNDEW